MIGRVLGDVHNIAKFFNLLNRDIVWNTIDVYRHVLTRDMDEGKHEQTEQKLSLTQWCGSCRCMQSPLWVYFS